MLRPSEASPDMTALARPSFASLLIETRAAGIPVATATGFIVKRGVAHYLVTNYHVLANRARINGHYIVSHAQPDEVLIWQNVAGQLCYWRQCAESLRDSNGPVWFEHPIHGRLVDVAALELRNVEGVDFYSHDPQPVAASGSRRPFVGVASQVSVVGFPFGLTAEGRFPIWVQGSIASEPKIDFQKLPCFLVDSRTRSGNSGSPVLIYAGSGSFSVAGGTVQSSGPVELFLGVYSSRIVEAFDSTEGGAPSAEKSSDLGLVWKPSAIIEVIDGRKRGQD